MCYRAAGLSAMRLDITSQRALAMRLWLRTASTAMRLRCAAGLTAMRLEVAQRAQRPCDLRLRTASTAMRLRCAAGSTAMQLEVAHGIYGHVTTLRSGLDGHA